MIQPRAGESDRAKQRAEGARVVPFDPKRLSTVVALGMGGDKGSALLFHEALLEHGEDLLRFREGQAESHHSHIAEHQEKASREAEYNSVRLIIAT
jgi:hypothetical protein